MGKRIADEPWGLARLVLIPLERAARCGLSRGTLLHDARLDEAQLHDPDGRIPVAAVVRFWRAVAARAADPAIGLRLARDVRVREFGLVGYTMVSSKTLGAALRRLDRYDRIVSDTLTVELDTKRDGTWIRLDVDSPLRALRPAADARVAALVSVCRELAGSPIHPLAVRLPYRTPNEAAGYQQFFRAPVEFGALATAFLLETRHLELPIADCDDTLAGYLDRLAEQLLAPHDGRDTVREQIRRRLWSDLPDGVPSLESVARRLGMSTRTLQRRLREERTTFHRVVVEFRHDAAPSLLREGRLSVSEVAFLLGYEDPSSFQRAFRRAFGVSPRVYRGRRVGQPHRG